MKTKHQREREKMEQEVYLLYQQLTADPENARTEINRVIMERFGIYSMSTVYAIVHRVEKRIGAK